MKEKIEKRYNELINEDIETRVSNLFEKDLYIRNNIFFTNFKYKLDSKIKISEQFPIFLRNPFKCELESIGSKIRSKILSILKSLDDISIILNMDDFTEKITLKDFDLIDIIHYSNLIVTFVKENNNDAFRNLLKKGSLNCYNLSLFIVEDYLQDLILIEVEDWKKIDEILAIYYNLKDVNEIEARDYRFYFFDDYMNLFNKVNFSQKHFTGLGHKNNDLTFLHDASYNINNPNDEDYENEIEMVLTKPIVIDSFIKSNNDKLYFQYIIETLNSTKLRTYRNRCISYIAILEFMLTKQRKTVKDKSIKYQFCNNIIKCYEYLNDKISKKELKLIYEYRSSILHGDFTNVKICFEKIIKLPYYEKRIKNIKKGFSEWEFDTTDYEEILTIRLNEIFRKIYILFCTQPNIIKNIKNNL